MTIHYRKVLKSISWIAVCLLGIEQIAFASGETTPPKKENLFDRGKRAANSAKNEVMKSKPVTAASNAANAAKEAAVGVAGAAKDRVVNSKAGKAAQQAVDDVNNRMCTFKLIQARATAEKLRAIAGHFAGGASQLDDTGKQQDSQAGLIKKYCNTGILCSFIGPIASLFGEFGEKYSGLATKANNLTKEMYETARSLDNKVSELETKCGSTTTP